MKVNSSVFAVAALFVATFAAAQEQRGEAKTTLAGKAVSIEYGRPVLAGRDMLAQAKPNSPWRMGSGSPTSLKTDVDLTFGSVAVPKGSYILEAVKDDKGTWTMLAKANGSDSPALRIPLASATAKDSVEQFTITLTAKDKAGEFAMVWGTAKMTAAFSTK